MTATNEELVEELVREGWVKTERVKKAFLKVDRGRFVPAESQGQAYVNHALPIGFGQTISQPLVVALTTEALDVGEGHKVLDVGCGSGYQTALLAELAGSKGRVYAVDRVPELVEGAKTRLAGKRNVEWVVGDGSLGLPGKAPFDRVVVTAACPSAPPALLEQLREGGKLVAPVGSRWHQDLVLVEKVRGEALTRSLLPVVFVPLVGEQGF